LPSQIDISVIIVSYNCRNLLEECLRSVAAQEGVTHEIIVVDNASKDGAPEFLKSQGIKKMLSPQNVGFGVGANIAAGMADGDYLLILNPDTTLPPGTLKALRDFTCEVENAGLVSPSIVGLDGTVQRSARSLPTRLDFLFGRGSPLFKLGITGEKRAGYIESLDDGPARVPAVSATAAFIRADLFRSLGGFDPRFFMYLEDIDLCKRIGERGLDVWLHPGVKVIHGWGQSSKTRPYFTAFHHHLSVLKYFQKHYPRQPIRNLLLAIALALGFIVSSLLMLLGRGKRR
jgi:hypothetical protein